MFGRVCFCGLLCGGFLLRGLSFLYVALYVPLILPLGSFDIFYVCFFFWFLLGLSCYFFFSGWLWSVCIFSSVAGLLYGFSVGYGA